MKLNVLKNNLPCGDYDFSNDIQGLGLEALSLYVGRSDECHIMLDDMMISREHFELNYSNEKWTLVNLSDFSSVQINGVSEESFVLSQGDKITIGAYTIIVTEIVVSSSNENALQKPVALGELDSKRDDIEVPTEVRELSDSNELENEEDESSEDFSKNNIEETSEYQSVDDDIDNQFSDTAEKENSMDDEYGEVDLDEESDGTQIFQSFSKVELSIFGEFAPFDTFKLDEGEIIIGRDKGEAQIVLKDSEVSSKHAKIRKTKISVMIEDMDSGNGTLLNGARINKSELTNGDEFIIGSTTFTVHIYSDFLEREENRLMPVEENQVKLIEERIEVEGDTEEGLGALEDDGPLSFKDRFKSDSKFRIKIIIGVILILVVLLMDSGDAPSKKVVKKRELTKKVIRGKKLTEDEREMAESTYQLAKELQDQGKYGESLFEIQKVLNIDPKYRNAKQIFEISKEGLARLEKLEQKRQAEIEKKLRQKRVLVLVEKAKKSVQDKKFELSHGLFAQILELDPGNFDVPQLRIEIDSWKKEEERIALEKAQKKSERNRQLNLIKPAETLVLKKEWFKAINSLSTFLKEKDIDKDLITKATTMLKNSKDQLSSIVMPLLGKARSLKEGQDLKGAYELYGQVLFYDPSSEDALNERDEIKDLLRNRARKVYREALISESLSLFDEAREKFQEVKQISPSDSEYYRKADEKVKDYLE